MMNNQYEKEQLVGITLGINNGRIDSRILSTFGFDKEVLKNDINVSYHFYKVKERRNTLDVKYKKTLDDIKNIIETNVIIKLMDELKKSNISIDELKENPALIQGVIELCKTFKPSILLHGKKQVFWNIDSYIHIVARHIKDYQLGDFKDKSQIPYKVDDLKSLIEKVISSIDKEYEEHIQSNPQSNFTRQGKMAVFFNDDHYNLRIAPNGRLVQFYAVS